MEARAEDPEARLGKIYAPPDVYSVLDLRFLITYCEKLASCKKIIDTLKEEQPLGSNYVVESFFDEKNCLKWKLYNVNRMPSTCFFSCLGFNRKDNLQFNSFYRTTFNFGEHIKVYGLTHECRLRVSEEHNRLIQALRKCREEHIADLLASKEEEGEQKHTPPMKQKYNRF